MDKPKIINLPKIVDERGNLTFFENKKQIPFDIRRCYWIYDITGDKKREGHAFKNQQEFIVALSGSFDVVINDGIKEDTFTLNEAHKGLLIPPRFWRNICNFSTNSVAFIVSDTDFDESDYIREFSNFKNILNE